MKIKISTAFILLMIFLGTTSFASNKPNIEQVRQTIANHISYPEFAKEKLMQGNVKVFFGINNDSKLVVYSATSVYKELSDYVNENMTLLEVNDLEADKIYSIVITFSLH